MSGGFSSSSSQSTENTTEMDSDTFIFENDPVVEVMNLLNFSVVCRSEQDTKSKEIESLKLSLERERTDRQDTQAKLEALSQSTSLFYNELANVFRRITSMTRKNVKTVSRRCGLNGTKVRRQRHILEIGPFKGHAETSEVYSKLKILAENFQKGPYIFNPVESLKNINEFLADCLTDISKLAGVNGNNVTTDHPPIPSAPPIQIQVQVVQQPNKAKEIEIIQLDDEMSQNLQDSQQNLMQLSTSTTPSPSQQVDTECIPTEVNSSSSHAEDSSKTSTTIKGYHCRCGFSCSIKPLLDSHIKCYNSKWKCDLCNKRFMDKRLLDSHNVERHAKHAVIHKVNSTSCKNRCSCGKAFFEKNLLMLHIASKGRL